MKLRTVLFKAGVVLFFAAILLVGCVTNPKRDSGGFENAQKNNEKAQSAMQRAFQ